MRVILKSNVPKIGLADSVHDVADGYYRNFLLPQGLAIPATKEALDSLKVNKQIKDRRKVKDEKQLLRRKKQIGGLKFEIKKKANENGTLFSSVSTKELLSILLKSDMKVDQENFHLYSPIKQVGDYEVVLDFGSAGKSSIFLKVAREDISR